MTTGISHSVRSMVLARLRTLRASLAQARDALMHFKADRADRDRLEPAARRVDDLMNLFAGNVREPAQGSAWLSEILVAVDAMANPKATDALSQARADIAALREVMGPAADARGNGSGRGDMQA